jgi:hypothetical protein
VRGLVVTAALLAALAAAPGASQTGQDSQIHHTFLCFDQGGHLPQIVAGMGPIPHKRVEFAAYYSGRPGSIWDLASKPASLAAYRTAITPLG